MATKKAPVLEFEDEDMELEEVSEHLEDMVNKAGAITYAVPKKAKEKKGVTVQIFLPEIQGSGGDLKVDQYEHVTIANEEDEVCYKVHRGEYVDVPVEVFIQLKAKYPNL
jgi:hypothetical protein